MTDDRLKRIRTIQAQIVDGLEKGEDVSSLRRELKRIREEIAEEADFEALKKVAEARQGLRNKGCRGPGKGQ
jgi:hypothetical protein